jgi:hypothetical protein
MASSLSRCFVKDSSAISDGLRPPPPLLLPARASTLASRGRSAAVADSSALQPGPPTPFSRAPATEPPREPAGDGAEGGGGGGGGGAAPLPLGGDGDGDGSGGAGGGGAGDTVGETLCVVVVVVVANSGGGAGGTDDRFTAVGAGGAAGALAAAGMGGGGGGGGAGIGDLFAAAGMGGAGGGGEDVDDGLVPDGGCACAAAVVVIFGFGVAVADGGGCGGARGAATCGFVDDASVPLVVGTEPSCSHEDTDIMLCACSGRRRRVPS